MLRDHGTTPGVIKLQESLAEAPCRILADRVVRVSLSASVYSYIVGPHTASQLQGSRAITSVPTLPLGGCLCSSLAFVLHTPTTPTLHLLTRPDEPKMPHPSDHPYPFSAPLPSPTSTAPQHFHFPPSSSQHPFQTATAAVQQHLGTQQHSNQYSHNQTHPHSHALSNTHQQQSQQSQSADMSNQAAQTSIAPSNDPSSPLRRDFGLLAEAAKRAQIAVITRDLGDVGL